MVAVSVRPTGTASISTVEAVTLARPSVPLPSSRPIVAAAPTPSPSPMAATTMSSGSTTVIAAIAWAPTIPTKTALMV